MVNSHPQPKPIVYLELLAACVIFLLITFTLPGNLSWSLRATVGITGASVWLWVLEPIPLALTSLLVIVALPILFNSYDVYCFSLVANDRAQIAKPQCLTYSNYFTV